MRITPLPTAVYFGAKILSGYLVAAVSIVLLYAAGLALGVSLPAAGWFWMTVLILIGLIPFAVIGVLLGHLITSDSMGPALGGVTSVFALLGGAWGPLATGGAFQKVVELLPSHWLVQAGRAAVDSRVWPAEGWIVVAVWSLVMLRLARLAYRRDTFRV
jgi:ABC-2 type transport system permease protein